MNFRNMTELLLESVSKHDFETLSSLCDDDFGIVDLDTQAKNVIIRTRLEWENWFQKLFIHLDALKAQTHSEITQYDELVTSELAYCVVEFTQYLIITDESGNTQKLPFGCIATIIWKKISESQWKESRWHVSLISSPL